MKILQRIWDDLRKGENIDLYITVIVAISMAFLNVVGASFQTHLASITLAILGLLAINSLGNRYRIEELLNRHSQTIDRFYLEDYPSSYRNNFETADELWLFGVSLRRTIHVNYRTLELKLKLGH